jgi:spermidine synthase
MSETFSIEDNIIFQEMMSHPALFSHPHPKTVAIVGDESGGILREILKHPAITQTWHTTQHALKDSVDDNRAIIHTGNLDEWIATMQPESLDILIIAQSTATQDFVKLQTLINPDGMMIQQSGSPFQLEQLKSLQTELTQTGFADIHFLSFPQPHYPSGWRTALIAKKHHHFRRIREKDIFNKTFSTRYYNYDVHKASLVLPEFMREELELQE